MAVLINTTSDNWRGVFRNLSAQCGAEFRDFFNSHRLTKPDYLIVNSDIVLGC